MTTPCQLRGAVVGFGSIGHRHCENLARLGVAELTVVRRPEQPNPAFQPPATARVVHSNAEAVAAGLDFAVICSPTRLHVETAKYYMDAGVPVLIEKPISDRDDDARLLAEEARRRGIIAGMAYCMRYHPVYAAARQAVHDGRIGRVLYAKSWFESYLPAWHPWEDYRQSYAARKDLGGGALRTLDHEIDFMNWCLGTPDAVIGHSSRSDTIEINADDNATLLIRYQKGAIANISLSLCRKDRSRGFEFVGDQGTLAYDWDSQQLRCMSSSGGESILLDYRNCDFAEMYVDMLKDFLNVVAGNVAGEAFPSLDCGLDAINVCCLAESHTFSKHLD
jgi:predicted dehydrogenase